MSNWAGLEAHIIMLPLWVKSYQLHLFMSDIFSYGCNLCCSIQKMTKLHSLEFLWVWTSFVVCSFSFVSVCCVWTVRIIKMKIYPKQIVQKLMEHHVYGCVVKIVLKNIFYWHLRLLSCLCLCLWERSACGICTLL